MAVEDPYRDKAAEREIDGPYKDGAREVRRLLGWEKHSPLPFLSTRNAQHKTGISNGTINTMANGGKVSMNTVELFALKVNGDAAKLKRLFGYVSPEEITASETDPISRIGREVNTAYFDDIPVSLKMASAGRRIKGEDYADEEPVSSRLPANTRGIEVEGDCMEPFFHHGDLLFIRPQSSAENGQKVVALLDDDSITCKVFRQSDDHVYLEATNGKYPRIDAGHFTIIGVVQKFMRDV